MEIFKLVGSIFVDNDKANESLQKTDKKAGSVGETLANGAKKAGVFAAGVATAAATAVAGMVKVASSTATAADEIDKASQRMGIGAEEYQELSHAASLCGVEMSTMEKAAKALEGTDISFDDAMEQIYALGTAEERSAKAAELFGETVAYKMSPMLNASAEDMDAMKQEARDLGIVMSEDTVKSGATLNDTITKVKESMSALANGIGSSLMPIVQEGAEMILSFMPTLQTIVQKIGPTLQELLSTLLPIIFDLAQEVLPPLVELIDALLPLFQTICELILPLLISLLKFVVNVLVDYVIPAIKKVVEAVRAIVNKAPETFKKLKDTIVNTFEAIKDGVKKPINAVITMINKLINGLNSLNIDVPDWVTKLTGMTSFGFNIKNIPLLAEGGEVRASGPAIVGEAGAELVDLPSGARVTPLNDNNNAFVGMEEKMEAMLEQMRDLNENLLGTISAALNGTTIDWDDRNLGRLVQQYAR